MTRFLIGNASFPIRKKFFPYRKFLPLFLWLAAGLLAAVALRNPWQVNAWSLAFARPAVAQGLENVFASQSPAIHRRAAIWLARQALAKGDRQGALYSLSAAPEKQDAPMILAVLGGIYAEQGDTDVAISVLSRAQDYQVLQSLAKQWETSGNLQGALQAYRAASVIYPDAGILPFVQFLWRTWGSEGGAEAVLRRALRSYPDTASEMIWFRQLASILAAESRWEEAERLYEYVLHQNPRDYWAYIGLGQVYYGRGDGEIKAMRAFQKAIAIAPDKGFAYSAMGQMLLSEGQNEQADLWLALAIQYNPDIQGWWLTRANAMRSIGQLDKALSIYQEAVSRFPDSAIVYYEMAWAWKLEGNTTNAIQSIEQALALSGMKNGWYYYRAGQIYEWSGDLPKALTAYQTAFSLLPDEKAIENDVTRVQRILEE